MSLHTIVLYHVILYYTLQLAAAGGRLFLLDALRPGLVAALAPLLESDSVAKVYCRWNSKCITI